MTLEETLARLKSLGDEKMRLQNKKYGAGDNQFGVRLGDIRKPAREIKTNHELAVALLETGTIDARLLAILLIKPKNLSVEEIDRAEMPNAAPEVQWTMNACLAGIGIHFPNLRKRAITIGEMLGIYRDYPVSKGCILPFAPIWINEMVRRQG